ncbi:MAG TPA: serine hydrolase [Sphingomonadaceae bacterium]|jgi:CubicO group peptidase (beta-lactamase class C family)|nr:serine hydrolase [Sphingomonadaceae bacterium]
MRILALPLLAALASCQTATITPAPAAAGAAQAWVAFDASGLRRSGAYGLADRAQNRRLTIDDPVRVASVSKLVVALGVMRLVEAGRLDLDTDVSQYLGWTLRNPAFPDTPVTLRLLLSHRSSLRDDGEAYAIPLGRTLREAVAAPAAWDADHTPATHFRYANINFPVIASVMERAGGERFDRLMHRLVLRPLALDACFNWTTCTPGAVARGVALHHADGSPRKDDLAARQSACQVNTPTPAACDLSGYRLGENGALFSPQGGLRVSLNGLATIGRVLLNDGRHGGQAFLSPASIAAILRPAWRFDGANGDTSEGFYCAYGLASQTLPTLVAGCRDDLFGSGRAVVGHAGEAFGLLSGLWIDPRRRVGIAYFGANNPAPSVPGRSAYRAVEESLAAGIPD